MDLLTPREVAKELRLGRDTTYRLLRDGLIPSVRLGRAIRVPRVALIEHIDHLAREAVTGSTTRKTGRSQ